MRLPCKTPGRPAHSDAACRPLASPSPAASTPISLTLGWPMYGWKIPMAFEPPPTQAITASGWRPAISCICWMLSSPITDWKSRTIIG